MSLAPDVGLSLRIRNEGAETIITAQGEIDVATVTSLRKAIDAAIETGAGHVAIEMPDVDFLDSSGLSALIHGYKRAEASNQQFEVRDPSRVVLRLLRLTGQLDRFVAPRSRATA